MKKLILLSLLLLSSCYVQKQNKPKIMITHVLAVTEQGDTLRLPIGMIKPNVYYNVINYGTDYWRPYYNRWDYLPFQHHNNNSNIYVNNNNNTNNNTNNNNNNNNNNTHTELCRPPLAFPVTSSPPFGAAEGLWWWLEW